MLESAETEQIELIRQLQDLQPVDVKDPESRIERVVKTLEDGFYRMLTSTPFLLQYLPKPQLLLPLCYQTWFAQVVKVLKTYAARKIQNEPGPDRIRFYDWLWNETEKLLKIGFQAHLMSFSGYCRSRNVLVLQDEHQSQSQQGQRTTTEKGQNAQYFSLTEVEAYAKQLAEPLTELLQLHLKLFREDIAKRDSVAKH
ncbi:unnamed protein product, partial [Amoebophrya sp. A120]|eukprot:GSA120T00008495001.1